MLTRASSPMSRSFPSNGSGSTTISGVIEHVEPGSEHNAAGHIDSGILAEHPAGLGPVHVSACQAIRTGLLPTLCIVRSRPPAGRAAPPGGAGGGRNCRVGAGPGAPPDPRGIPVGSSGGGPGDCHTGQVPHVCPGLNAIDARALPRHYGERERAPWVCVIHGAAAPGEPPGIIRRPRSAFLPELAGEQTDGSHDNVPPPNRGGE